MGANKNHCCHRYHFHGEARGRTTTFITVNYLQIIIIIIIKTRDSLFMYPTWPSGLLCSKTLSIEGHMDLSLFI